jgi:hypothetical protein
VRPRWFYAGLFLVTACTLMLQVVQTRILSVVAWYHLAFFAISMAMFGLTAGAVWLYLRRGRFTEQTLSYDLAHYTTAFALSAGIGLLMQMTQAPVVLLSVTGIWTWMQLAICIAIPFFFSGIVVSLALTRSPFPIGRVYGWDLLGAASGCLGVLMLLNATDGPSVVLWIAAIAAAAAVCFARSGVGTAPNPLPASAGLLRHRLAILVILAAAAFLNGRTANGLQPLVVKGNFENGGSYLFRKWNTFSRVVVLPEYEWWPELWGPSPTYATSPERAMVNERWLVIDGDAGTIATQFNGDVGTLGFLKYDVTTLAYHLPGRTRNAVIGVGGGRDILSAAAFGSKDITAVELNPTFVRLLKTEPGFANFTNLDRIAGLRLLVDEGRSWFARSTERFDVIQMSLIDTWAATGAGAFSLSENGLYTVEAWKTFLGRLTDRGVYTVSRWYSADDPSETGRMLSLAVGALLDLGVSAPDQHIFMAATGKIATIVVSRQPLSATDLQALHEATARYQYQELITPEAPPKIATLRAIVGARSRDALEAVTSDQEFDLTPATDDRPFFFNQLPISRPLRALAVSRRLVATGRGTIGGIRSGNLVATATLVILFFVALTLVLATIVIPLRHAVRDVGRPLVIAGTLYFTLIGVGFMMVEIGILQRMSVFLGHPVYSLSVSLFALILTTGAGSLLSDAWVLDTRPRFAAWAAATGVYVISLRYWLPLLLTAFDSASLPMRAVICVGVIAPAGVLMGFAFPTGMRLVSAIDRRPTPWFWGMNGAAGVLASVVAIATSIAMGISATLLIGAACYLLLIPAAFLLIRQSWGTARGVFL